MCCWKGEIISLVRLEDCFGTCILVLTKLLKQIEKKKKQYTSSADWIKTVFTGIEIFNIKLILFSPSPPPPPHTVFCLGDGRTTDSTF